MYDVIIIGCGPAGMTAAIYSLRANKKVLILEKSGIGGQIASSPLVENYPGYIKISGSELSNNLYEQVVNLGGEIGLEEVIKIKDGKTKIVVTEDAEYKAKSIIIATGNEYRKLGLPNEEELIGKGIHFCVSCDGAFYKDKVVAVIGGGNTAVVTSLALSELCKKVYLIQNLEFLTSEKVLQDRINKKSNVEIIYNSVVKKLNGESELESIVIFDNKEEKELKIDGMFISIGLIPQNEFLKGLITLNENKFIVSDNDCHTNIEGIFVAGDCKDKKVRQITTATSDGTIAAIEAIKYLNN